MLNDIHKNIFLIGFMGSGKSHWGHIWAHEHGYTFYDLDAEIEKVFKLSVEEIFEKHGEKKFREMEKYHLRKFEGKKKFLLSCGGGTPCFFDNLEWMKQHGKVIYLQASPEYILDRVMDETSKRPLLKEVNTSELLFFIQKKLKEREPAYLRAHHVLEVEKLSKSSLHFLNDPATKKDALKTNEDSKKIVGSKGEKKIERPVSEEREKHKAKSVNHA